MPSLTKVQSGFVEAQGALPLSSGTAAAPGLKFDDHAGTGMFSPSTGEIAFSTSGHSQAITFKTDGKVGIGTNNPSLRAHIVSTANADAALIESTQNFATLRFKSATNTSGPTIGIDGAGGLQIDQKDTSKYIAFAVGTEKLRITASGYIKLSGRNVTGSANGGKLLRIYQPSRTDSEQDVLLLQSYNQETANEIIIGGGDSSYNAATDISFRTDAINTTSGTERLRIASDGVITINTVPATNNNANQAVLFQTAAGAIHGGSGLLYNPGEDALKVNGNIINSNAFLGAGAGPLILAVANYSSTQYIKVSNKIEIKGNVGIGTDNPVGNLEVRDSKANLIVAKDGLTVKSNSNLHTTYDMLQIGAGGALASYSTATVTADTQFIHNAYRHSGGTFKYRYADSAARIRMNAPQGTIIFDNAASGSADGDITFAERLRITAAGNIDIGNNSGSSSNSGWWIQPDGTAYVFSDAANDAIKIYAGSADERITLRGNGSASFASNALNISTAGNVTIANPTTSAKLNVLGDINGNYTGWKEKGVASGSMSAASIASKTPTINDFTYPNNSNGMLIWSTSKIGFAAGGESPQYGSGVQMLFDSGGLILGGNRAFDRTTVSSTATNWTVKLRTSGIGQFKGALYANPFQLTSSDSWIKSGYGAISNSTVSSLNNLMIAQNIRGYIQGIEGGSVNNNFYSVVTHSGMGYAGTEYCYGGITKFYNTTGSSTANNAITPVERFRVESSGVTVGAAYKFSNTGPTGTSLPNPYLIGNLSSSTIPSYPHVPGIYYIRADSPCDNTWRNILTSIAGSAFVFEGVSGDATSKRNFKLIGNPTSPAYGISRLQEDYNHGAWNTGDIEFRLNGSGSAWDLQVKTTSYYNSSNSATVRFHLFCYY